MNIYSVLRFRMARRLWGLGAKIARLVGIVPVLMLGGWVLSSGAGLVQSAEPTFVGILAFLDDPEVAKQLDLSAEQREKLLAFLESRESEALELALQLKNLSPGERAEKLLPFRCESERRGLALLTPEQQKKLQTIRLQRLGLASLSEEDIATHLGLTETQKAEVAKILRQREDRLAVTSKERAHIVRMETERQLHELLSSEQKARWESLLASTEPSPTEPSLPRPEGVVPSATAEAGPTPKPALSESASPGLSVPRTSPSGPTPPEIAQTESGKETAKTETAKTEGSPLGFGKQEGVPQESMNGEKSWAEVRPAPLPDDTTKPPPVGGSWAGGPMPSDVPGEPAGPWAKPPIPPKESALLPTMPGVSPSGSTPPLPSLETTLPGESGQLPRLEEVKLRFNFRYQPWKDVLEWFAQQAGLSLIMDDPPKGTFNYTDDKAYTPAEAIDLLNGILQTKGYVLVRRNRMLMVINLENGIPPLLIETIPVEELDRRGTYEVVSVAFQLQKLTPEEIEGEVQKMIGPQGAVVSLPKSRQLLVTDTVGRLRAIQRAIQRAEDPEGIHGQAPQLRQVPLQYASPNQVLPIVRQFLDIPPEQAASADGSIKIVADPMGKGLLVSGKEEKITRLMEILKILDIPENAAKSGMDQTPQLEVYAVAPADPNSVLAVIQTLLAGSPDARIALDPKTGNLVALCKPSEHATIRATLEQMQADPRKIEVITLGRVDPQTAATSLKKLFGIGDTPDPNKPQIEVDTVSKQLLVRATQTQLEQIKLLLEKMGEKGEGAEATTQGGNVRMIPITGRNGQEALERALEIWPTMHTNRIRVVRPSAVIPTMRPSSEGESSSSPSSTESSSGTKPWDTPEGMLEQLFGPLGGMGTPRGEDSGGAARTRIIRPPSGSPSGGPPGAGPKPPFLPGQTPLPLPTQPGPSSYPPTQPGSSRPGTPPPDTNTPRGEKPVGEKTTGVFPAATVRAPGTIFLVSGVMAAPEDSGPSPQSVPSANASESETSEASSAPSRESLSPVSEEAGSEHGSSEHGSSGSAKSKTSDQKDEASEANKANGEPPVIVVAPGPSGIMIASEDLEALDAFENLLNTLVANLPESNVTVFYLKHARAEVVADTLERIFGASSSSGGPPGGGGRGLLGDIAGAALGDAGGGILGTLLGLGGPGGTSSGLAPTGTIQITPDPRLNALVVQANPKDTEMIEELLKILDQEKGPEPVAVQPKARVIPVINTAAEDIADLIKEVYNDRLIGGGAAGQRPPTPQEFIQMLRGSGGSRRGSTGTTQADIQQKMAIGVDTRNNAIIVVAPDQLFEEVEQLVKQLDAAAAESNQTIRVVNLKNANPSSVQQALSALMGNNVQTGRTGTTSRTPQQQTTGGRPPGTQFQGPVMRQGGQSFPGVRGLQQFQGQFPFQGGSSRQGRFSRSGRQ